METPVEFTFDINGFNIKASYSPQFLAQAEQLLDEWVRIQKEKQRRILVFLAAPPAAGKSTLAALFARLAKQIPDCDLQALGMDGFHHYQSYIETHKVEVDGNMVPMKEVKGCPESFDFSKLKTYIKRATKEECLTWPLYNRKLHDVVDDQIDVHASILLIEGNYLLLEEAPWRELQEFCDVRMFIEAEEEALKARLLKRKMMGGALPHEALAFYEHSERRNIERILHHRGCADLILLLDAEDDQLKMLFSDIK